jgi:hypothetical protein
VNVRSSTSDTKRVTLAVTIEASRKTLPPFLIFKGAPNGCIANHEFAMYPDHGHYVCQKKAWMDKNIMNKWIGIVLIPWKNAKAPGIIPILILDAYCVFT